MTLPVKYRAEADADLLDIFEYIHADNPPAAYRVIEELKHACEILIAGNPRIGRRRHELAVEGLRSFLMPPFLIFYVPREGDIDVIRILHGARDFPAIFEAP